MSKFLAILCMVFSGLALVVPARAQTSDASSKIGFLGQGGTSLYKARLAAFRKELRERGRVEGKNLVVEYRYANGSADRLVELAEELVSLEVDVLVTTGTSSTRVAKAATGTIPIVMHAGNPVQTGLVESLARPGGNVTGLTVISGPEFYGKRLELLTEVNPSAKLIAVLWNPANRAHPPSVENIRATAQALNIALQSLEASTAADIERILALLDTNTPDGLLNLGDSLFNTHRKRIVGFVASRGIPGLYTHARYVSAGGLMSYGPNFVDLYRRMAIYVDKILGGDKPGDLPVERPRKFDLTVSLEAAEKLGISIPPTVLLRANKVIE